jgi:hypothetical protein
MVTKEEARVEARRTDLRRYCLALRSIRGRGVGEVSRIVSCGGLERGSMATCMTGRLLKSSSRSFEARSISCDMGRTGAAWRVVMRRGRNVQMGFI